MIPHVLDNYCPYDGTWGKEFICKVIEIYLLDHQCLYQILCRWINFTICCKLKRVSVGGINVNLMNHWSNSDLSYGDQVHLCQITVDLAQPSYCLC